MITKLELQSQHVPSEECVLRAVKSAFESLAEGHALQPSQTAVVLPDGEGDCIFYPGYVRSAGSFGVKVSPYLESRKRRGLGPVTAFTLLVSSESGLPELLVDSMRLTTERTAATTLLGVQGILGGRQPSEIGIVGAGAIGRSHARYARQCFPGARLVVFSPSMSRGDALGKQRRQALEAECSFVAVAQRIDQVLSGDVVMLCTSSGTPVIDVEATPANSLITSVGTNLPNTHEIDWRCLSKLGVYCDYRHTCPSTAGDMRLAIAEGCWSADCVLGDIPDLLRCAERSPTNGRTYFRATGLALEDIAVARLVAQ